jgi:hypothetical protein
VPELACPDHPLSVFPDGYFDFFTMAGVLLPVRCELGIGQRLLVPMADFLIGHSKPLGLDEHPNGDTTVADSGVAANHTWRFMN